MVLIEMHNSTPGARGQYIWSKGQPWPVPASEDQYVARIEVFGPEYDALAKCLPGGRDSGGSIPVRDWLPQDAPHISEMMRMHVATGII